MGERVIIPIVSGMTVWEAHMRTGESLDDIRQASGLTEADDRHLRKDKHKELVIADGTTREFGTHGAVMSRSALELLAAEVGTSYSKLLNANWSMLRDLKKGEALPEKLFIPFDAPGWQPEIPEPSPPWLDDAPPIPPELPLPEIDPVHAARLTFPINGVVPPAALGIDVAPNVPQARPLVRLSRDVSAAGTSYVNATRATLGFLPDPLRQPSFGTQDTFQLAATHVQQPNDNWGGQNNRWAGGATLFANSSTQTSYGRLALRYGSQAGAGINYQAATDTPSSWGLIGTGGSLSLDAWRRSGNKVTLDVGGSHRLEPPTPGASPGLQAFLNQYTALQWHHAVRDFRLVLGTFGQIDARLNHHLDLTPRVGFNVEMRSPSAGARFRLDTTYALLPPLADRTNLVMAPAALSVWLTVNWFNF